MAGDKYIKDDSGRLTEQAAVQTSAGAGNAGNLVALDSSGKLDITMMPTGVTAEAKTVVASEALSSGDLINLWNDGGTSKMRKADATTAGKEADGYVLAAVSSGASGTAYFDSINTGVSGLTIDTIHFLSTTAGGVTATAPSASGNVVQEIGKTTATGELIFRPMGRGWVKA
jgi:hypothetical protein